MPMNSLIASRVLFGGEVPADVAALLERAMQSYADTQIAETLLWQAQGKAPDALPVYFSLYKFYFYKGDMERAEQTARKSLVVSAHQGGFHATWTRLDASSANWADHASAAHFYLFSLKALAFIRLRQGDAEESAAILLKLAELDPTDLVGASVIRSIAEGAS
jgi:tetratricopeptide (TPR) repeat protein